MHIADSTKAKAQLTRLLDQAGDEVIIARAGGRLLRLTPLAHVLPPQNGAPLRRKLWVAEEFGEGEAESNGPSRHPIYKE